MADGLNKVMLIGNLGQDPELRFTQNGTAALTLRVATNERFKQGDEWKDRTEWHTVVVWGARAEFLGKNIHKGAQLYVEGRIQTREWEDREGNKRYSTEIVAFSVLLLGPWEGQKGGQRQGAPQRGKDYGEPQSGFADDDIPF